MVYCGGHGATKGERQQYLLNNKDAKQVIFPLQYKLEFMILPEQASLCRIFAVYDCCRMPIEDLKGLHEIEKKRGSQYEEDELEQGENEPCKYFHIQACGPGGVADADGGFAEKVYNHSVKFAKKDQVGVVKFPKHFHKLTWPGIFGRGGKDYSLAFDIEASKTFTKQEESKK